MLIAILPLLHLGACSSRHPLGLCPGYRGPGRAATDNLKMGMHKFSSEMFFNFNDSVLMMSIDSFDAQRWKIC